jgi:DNA polymerase III alpha subunit
MFKLQSPKYHHEEWGTKENWSKEREVVGVYISGHPLDDFSIENRRVSCVILMSLCLMI